jgi:glutaredoxin
MKRIMPQECPLAFVYLTWLLYAAGLVYFPIRGNWPLAGVWLLALPLALWGYVSAFPRISRFLGYGRVDDVPAPDPARSSRTVTMYSSLGCPFCPVVERRLRALEQEMGFELKVVDVTLKPDLVLGKRIRSVPVVEVDDTRIVGHATSEQLADLITEER